MKELKRLKKSYKKHKKQANALLSIAMDIHEIHMTEEEHNVLLKYGNREAEIADYIEEEIIVLQEI